MEKKKGIAILIFIVLISIANFLSYYRTYYLPGITGMSIAESFVKRLSSFDFITIAFILQWVFVIVLLIILIREIKKSKSKLGKAKKIEKKSEEIVSKKELKYKHKNARINTDIDSFYSELEKRGKMKISDIVKMFGIGKEKAFEWCKILEKHSLLEVRHHPLREAEVIIKKNVKKK